MFEAPATAPMELGDYLRILRRRAWVVVVVTLLAMGVAVGWYEANSKTYTATGEVVVKQGTGEVDVVTQAKIIESAVVYQLAQKKVPAAVGVSAEQSGDSGSINIVAESTDAKIAAASVNAQMDAYVEYLRKRAEDGYTATQSRLQPQIDSLQQQVDALDLRIATGDNSPTTKNQRTLLSGQLSSLQDSLTTLQLELPFAGSDVQVIRRAVVPSSPSSMSLRDSLLIGLGAGLLFGILAAFLLEFLDDSVRTRQDLLGVAGGDVPVLGVIPVTRSARAGVVSLTEPSSPTSEAYRSLRTAVHFAASDQRQCVAVTTSRSRQGKTETVVNLAVLAAQTGQRVVVVDCDMRSPRVHDFFGLPNDTGFTSVVYGEPLSKALKRVPGSENLYVLPAGPVPTNPAALLASQRCYEVLASLQADDTLVLIDTPPLLVVTDAAQLAPVVGGMLLVATARVSRRKQLRRALEQLRQVSAPVLGMVLYRADSTETDGFGQEASRRERRQARRRQKTIAPDAAGLAPYAGGSDVSEPPSASAGETG
jgi:succinoglycan biosynthesis transport protein ExoP